MTRRMLLLLLAAFPFSHAHADEGRSTPGLVVETGARNAVADGIAFTPDGKELLAWGEDKVVRRWGVGYSGFTSPQSTNIRWPMKSGQPRGSIFALAMNSTGRQAVIGGFGYKDGLLARLGFKPGGGDILSVATPTKRGVVWAIAYSPDDDFVVYGNDFGELFRWDLAARKVEPFTASQAGARPEPNRVRLLKFTGRDRFVSVAMDGVVRQWSLTGLRRPPKELAKLKVPNVLRAVLSPNNRWLAATGSARKGSLAEAAAVGTVELIDLEGRAETRLLRVPSGLARRVPRCLAFDTESERLAVGCQDVPRGLKTRDFFRLVGGSVLFYDLAKKEFSRTIIELTYRADAISFHPRRSTVLAVAGGANHELALCSTRTGKRLGDGIRSVIRSPGNCLWGVAFSRDGKHFAWQEERNPSPSGKNDWGAGPWRVFDIASRDVMRTAPAGFAPIAPIMAADGWSIEPTRSSRVWEVVGPGELRQRLEGGNGSIYNSEYNQEPRCWTFIRTKGQPLRLAVGHQWGASLYECRASGLRLIRVMNGHEGEVMAVAPNADGTLLLTAGRDQTVCCWSLARWPAGSELGAAFAIKGGKLVVTEVDNGSPAWEALNPLRGTDEEANRLKAGDVIDLMVIANERFVYDGAGLFAAEARKVGFPTAYRRTTEPADALRLLRRVKPAQQYILGKRIGGKGPVVYKLSTVRQRPLWRMFATRAGVGREWVLWRPRDFFYDTSANADSFVGWHVNDANLAQTPAFHPLEHYRGTDRVGKAGAPNGFHRPDMVWRYLLTALPPVMKVVFADIEAPRVEVRILKPAAALADLQVEVTVEPVDGTKPAQAIAQSVLMVNQTEVPAALRAGAINKAVVTIPRSRLQWGDNLIKVMAFNARGGRGEAMITTDYTPPGKPSATLHALVVGINDYTKAPGYDPRDGVSSLLCSRTDAEEMKRVLTQHARSKLFGKADIVLVPEKEATAPNILARLKKMGATVKPDDWLVVYLSGHGDVDYKRDAEGNLVKDDTGKKIPRPRTYFYVCRDFDIRKPATKLTSAALYKALSAVACRKLLILDTCHSGGATVIPSDAARDMNPEGRQFLVMSSCQTDQKALEPSAPSEKFKHGFFTNALLDLISDSTEAKGKSRTQAVPTSELAKQLPAELERILAALGVAKGSKNFYAPAFLLSDSASTAVLCRPEK